ncbi:hypothetical protein [Caulobacter rhizosphaerae]|uniref:hypothetical protein n=1 Tax=Caulobacter rhizosphaerae TaxID=2010972 RepID=UPI0013D6AF26|nr:hypothetical protein [Caulobacter rhizosphaerae]
MFEFTTTRFDDVDRELIAAHIASGKPRYSNTLYLNGGGSSAAGPTMRPSRGLS